MKQLTPTFFYPLTGMAALASLTSCADNKKEVAKQYNIVYIMTDDHTAQMMSCYGSRFIETPNLDRIANDGVIFTNSFVANSLSGPSRACMLTGKHSHANGFTDNTTCIFDGSQQTVPKLLRKAGYQTAIIGKWHLVSLPTGFDHWEIVPEQGDYYNPDFINMNNDTIRKEGYITNLITDMSIDWMENQRDKEKPFCLFIHHKAIHRNWLPELKYLSLYEDKTYPLPENFYDDYEGRPAAAAQEMSIAKDMDLIYDNKMNRPDKVTPLKERYESYVGRLNPEDRKVYDAFKKQAIAVAAPAAATSDYYGKYEGGGFYFDWSSDKIVWGWGETVCEGTCKVYKENVMIIKVTWAGDEGKKSRVFVCRLNDEDGQKSITANTGMNGVIVHTKTA